MISKQLFKSSIIYSVIGALPYVSGVILIPFFTNHLTPQQFGVNVIYYSMMVLFQVIAGFSMEALIGVYYFEFKDNRKRLRELIGMVLIFSFTLGGALLLAGSAFGPKSFKLLWPDVQGLSFFPFGFITIITAVFNAGFKFYTSLLISQQRPTRFLAMSLLNFTMTIVLSLILLRAFPYTLNGPILGRMIPAGLTFLLSIILMNYEFGFAFNRDLIRPILSFCVPVFIYSIMIWIVNNIDRFIIQSLIKDSTYVGVYDIAVKITLFIDLFQTGLANSINPKILNIWKEEKVTESTLEVNRYYNVFNALTILVIPVIVITIPWLVPIVIKKQVYYEALKYLPILTLGFATRGWFFMFSAPVYYFKQTKKLPKIFLFSAIFQIVSSYFLIKTFGIMGAVWANFLIKPIQALFLYIEARKFFTFKVNNWKIYYLPLCFILVVITTDAISSENTRLYFQFIQLLTSILLVYFSYRKELMPMINKLLSR